MSQARLDAAPQLFLLFFFLEDSWYWVKLCEINETQTIFSCQVTVKQMRPNPSCSLQTALTACASAPREQASCSC